MIAKAFCPLPCLLGALTLPASPHSYAQADYPSRPIRLVMSSAAGGTGDTLARAVARLVEKDLHTSIVVDNRPGATGIIATDTVAKAEPNGYTLLHTSSSLVTNAATGRKLPYDVTRDFIPVTSLAMAEGYLVLVNPGLKVESVRELIALARTTSLLYGSPGAGNPIHFTTESLNQRAGTTMMHVPYKGLAPALIALVSGEIQVLLAPPLATRQHVAAGTMRALASVSAKRIAAIPDLPTMEEIGFAGFTLLGGWQGWFAPAKTPQAIIAKLQRAVANTVHSDELRGYMQNGGYIPDGRSPAEFRALVLSDYQRFRELARTANIRDE